MVYIFKAIHYCYLIYLRTFKIYALKYMNFLAHFLSTSGLAWQAVLKKTKVKLDLLTDINMLLMVEKVSEEEYASLLIDMQKLIANT